VQPTCTPSLDPPPDRGRPSSSLDRHGRSTSTCRRHMRGGSPSYPPPHKLEDAATAAETLMLSDRLSPPSEPRYLYAAAPYLSNLMWTVAGLPDGSFYFENYPNMLDQFLVNENMATRDAAIKANPPTPQSSKCPPMVDKGIYAEANSVRRNG
jgi:hypothetical protein